MTLSNQSSSIKKILAAAFYGATSILIMIINKNVLTNYRFPSAQFLGLGQMIAAVLILAAGKTFGFLSFPGFHKYIFLQIFPLPLLYFGNLVSGLGGTKQINLAMFTVLRRFSILFTMILEIVILKKKPSNALSLSICTIIFGSLLAASNDLAFDLVGYIFVLCNDVFTAANNVFTKKKLNADELGKYGIIFYNSLFMIVPSALLTYSLGDMDSVASFPNWDDPLFLLQFLSSCAMGFILMFSITLCTAYNSALTTTVVGCIKNIAITYIGMFFGGDYIFSWTNFIGINISVLGGVVYSYFAFRDKESKSTSSPEQKKGNAIV